MALTFSGILSDEDDDDIDDGLSYVTSRGRKYRVYKVLLLCHYKKYYCMKGQIWGFIISLIKAKVIYT